MPCDNGDLPSKFQAFSQHQNFKAMGPMFSSFIFFDHPVVKLFRRWNGLPQPRWYHHEPRLCWSYGFQTPGPKNGCVPLKFGDHLISPGNSNHNRSLVGGLEYEFTMVINHLPPIMGQSMGFDETINRNLQLVGGLEPWNFMTFPISWE